MSLRFDVFDATPDQLGESPCWDAARQCLWWVDIAGRALRMRDLNGQAARFDFHEAVTSVHVATNGRLLLGFVATLALFDPETGRRTTFCLVESGVPHENRLNDAKVGPDGCIWVGSMHDGPARFASGALYRVTPKGEVTRIREGLKVSNALAWSADGRTMIHADSRAPFLQRAPFDPQTGTPGAWEEIGYDYETAGRPDGGAMAADGTYWSAGVSAGRLNGFEDAAGWTDSVQLPVRRPTMIAFGGPDMRTGFITSISRDLTPAPGFHDGQLLIGAMPAPGVPIAPFAPH